jgi:hypothetical protein
VFYRLVASRTCHLDRWSYQKHGWQIGASLIDVTCDKDTAAVRTTELMGTMHVYCRFPCGTGYRFFPCWHPAVTQCVVLLIPEWHPPPWRARVNQSQIAPLTRSAVLTALYTLIRL